MTNTEMNRFRKTLENKVVELNRSTRQRDGLVIEKTADAFDRMIRASERDLAVHTLAAESTRLREVQAALQRIDQGTYGACSECEEPVGRHGSVPCHGRLCVSAARKNRIAVAE